MPPPHFIASQLSHPRGLVGWFIRRMMNKGNARMNAYAVSQLELAATDRVLEIGFGGGLTIPSLLERAAFVSGVDRSRDSVTAAMRRFKREVAAARADFREGSVEKIPFDAGSFTKACTVNTIYFWSSLDAGFAEMRRVMAPGARVAVGFLPKDRMDRMGMPADIFTPRAPEDVLVAMTAAGFADASVTKPQPDTPWNVVVARVA